jgi:membrane-associated phospholipid phosphatase
VDVSVALRRRDPDRLVLLGLLMVLIASVVVFANIVEDYLTNDPIVRWDLHFATWLHEHSWSPLVDVFKVVTYAGNAVVLGIFVAAVALLFWRSRRRADAVLLFVAFAGAEVINGLLKLAFHRARPELAFVHLETYSFPSGHAAAATATFGTLAFLLCLRPNARRVLLALGATVMIVLVGFSRLYLGAHYLSDVLAGTCFGVFWASLCAIGYMLWAARIRSRNVSGSGSGGAFSSSAASSRIQV